MALAPELARRLYLSGAEIADFLKLVDVTDAVSPKDRPWKREGYPLGRSVDVLDLSNRTRSALNRGEIDTIAELLTYSPWDIRRRIWQAGEKTLRELRSGWPGSASDSRTNGYTTGKPLVRRAYRDEQGKLA